jgi:hypothetical protein
MEWVSPAPTARARVSEQTARFRGCCVTCLRGARECVTLSHVGVVNSQSLVPARVTSTMSKAPGNDTGDTDSTPLLLNGGTGGAKWQDTDLAPLIRPKGERPASVRLWARICLVVRGSTPIVNSCAQCVCEHCTVMRLTLALVRMKVIQPLRPGICCVYGSSRALLPSSCCSIFTCVRTRR